MQPAKIEHRPVSHKQFTMAKRLMKPRGWGFEGVDLYEAARAVGVRSKDLDKALWDNMGEWA